MNKHLSPQEVMGASGPSTNASNNAYIGDFPPWQGPTNIPYYPPICPQPVFQPIVYTFGTTTSEPYFPWKIRQVANGFVLVKNGVEYVFSEIKDLLEFLKKDVKGCEK